MTSPQNPVQTIAREIQISDKQISAAVELMDGGATIPFIARYRKEVTGSLTDDQLTKIRDRLAQLRELEKRRAAILKFIDEQKKLTPELAKSINAASTLSALEDLYLPFRPKRKTKGSIAKEKGLEPLAKVISAQKGCDLKKEATAFVDAKKGVEDADAALSGARDIIAEWINEDAPARKALRKLFTESSLVTSRVIKGKEESGAKYKDYFQYSQNVSRVPSHQMLALRRAEKEGVITFSILPDENKAKEILFDMFVKADGADSREVEAAAADAYKRLLSPSLENEIRLHLKKQADVTAIEIFSKNLKELLMASPLGQKRMLAVDPGLRTGSKAVCLDAQGALLDHRTVYLVGSAQKQESAKEEVEQLISQYSVEVIAVGNGTGSRETEVFIKSLPAARDIPVVLVSESGASVYSASEVARREFPDHDVTIRGAVSIGRRLMDPLAELVKIDPKSIGVGQYQHDVDQKLLKEKLDDVVMKCVNSVGVEINTASQELLTYVSGLGPAKAQSLIEFRNTNGPLTSLETLKEISGISSKVFEQAAGFLRIHEAPNPLDMSAVHPESYSIIEEMARDLNCSVAELMGSKERQQKINFKSYVTDQVGLPTLDDIKRELAKPGRDPRPAFELFSYTEGINTIEDLKPGMKLKGVVTNITAFGAFVDVGVHHDGLVHISELSDKFVKDPHDILKVHQPLNVTVLEVDLKRERIALSAKR